MADRYQAGDRWNILISLRETKSRGDIEDIYIERTVKNGFTQAEEWRQTEICYTTRRLKMPIVLPLGRLCRRAILQTRSTNRTEVLDSGHFHTLPDGRQILTWEKNNPRQVEVFTIRWTW